MNSRSCCRPPSHSVIPLQTKAETAEGESLPRDHRILWKVNRMQVTPKHLFQRAAIGLRREPAAPTPRAQCLHSTARPLDPEMHPTLSRLKTTGDSQPQSHQEPSRLRFLRCGQVRLSSVNSNYENNTSCCFSSLFTRSHNFSSGSLSMGLQRWQFLCFPAQSVFPRTCTPPGLGCV